MELEAWIIIGVGIMVFFGVMILNGDFPPDKEIVEECRQMVVAMTKNCT